MKTIFLNENWLDLYYSLFFFIHPWRNKANQLLYILQDSRYFLYHLIYHWSTRSTTCLLYLVEGLSTKFQKTIFLTIFLSWRLPHTRNGNSESNLISTLYRFIFIYLWFKIIWIKIMIRIDSTYSIYTSYFVL